jgi:putative ABC transport system permease protein
MASKTALAWHNFTHNKVRMTVSVAGVTFAVVLMFMQLGFLQAVGDESVVMIQKLDFDVCLRSPEYDYLTDARTIPDQRLRQALEIEGVESAAPLVVSVFSWRNPRPPEVDPDVGGQQRAILALGVPLDQPVFRDAAMQQAVNSQATGHRTVLVDTRTRREFGPSDDHRFGPDDLGVTVEVNGVALTIAGLYNCGTGLSAGGDILMSRQTFVDCLPVWPHERCSLGLLRLAKSMTSSERDEAVQKLREVLPDDVDVLTRQQVLSRERNRWVWQSNYGLIFLSGVIVAVMVGTAIVYQVLSSEVVSLMPEYATLKAMGYRNEFLAWVLVQQSLLLAVAAFFVGLGISQALLAATSWLSQVTMSTTRAHIVGVFIITVLMCCASGVAAVRKAFDAQPADLF